MSSFGERPPSKFTSKLARLLFWHALRSHHVATALAATTGSESVQRRRECRSGGYFLGETISLSLTFPVCCSLERTLCFHPMPPTQPFQTPLHPPTSPKHTTWCLTRSPPHHRCRAVRTVACLHSCSAGSAWSCSSATHLRAMTLAMQGHVTVRHIALL